MNALAWTGLVVFAGPQAVPSEPRGICLLDRAVLERAIERDEFHDLLEEHARAHGWPVAHGWPAVVPPERDVACNAGLVDMLVEELGVRRSHVYVVQALERNGRVDQALLLLGDEIARARASVEPEGAFAWSWLTLAAAQCAERAGRDDDALAFAASFSVLEGTRGTRWLVQTQECAAVVARAHLRRGRFDDVGLPSRSRWGAWAGWTDARVAFDWIEHELLAGRAATAELAVQKRILPRRPLAAEACDEAVALWQWLHGDLAGFAADDDRAGRHDLVARRLLALGPQERSALFRDALGTRRDVLWGSPLVHVGARLGLPELGDRFDALTAEERASLRGMPDTWRAANVPWRLGGR